MANETELTKQLILLVVFSMTRKPVALDLELFAQLITQMESTKGITGLVNYVYNEHFEGRNLLFKVIYF